ncbi:MAG: response regulator [Bacteroidetes bacterium]|nr:response regulator [Bacteroidota bacterium]
MENNQLENRIKELERELSILKSGRVESLILGNESSFYTPNGDHSYNSKVENPLNESEERFKLIFEKSITPIMVADDKGNYLEANKAAAEIFEYSVDELLCMNVADLITISTPNAASLFEDYIIKGEETGEFGFVSKNGTAKIVKYKAVRIKPDFNVSIMMDMTEQKNIFEELTKAKIQAEEAMNSKQQFLSNMSHEIRTPMTAIIGFSKVALKTDLTEKQKEYITAIKTSSDALLVLINDILDLAKVDAGKMTFEQNAFEMETNISAMLQLFDLKIQEKNLECIKEYDKRIPKVLIGDSVRLNQIFLNLVSNAIKFTSKGKIIISVRIIDTKEDNVTIEFAVSDTGIGVAENMIPKLFESFQQATSSIARQYGGTGLGLTIVKKLVELQGGTMSVKSKLNEGSTFSFVLSFQKTNKVVESELTIPELIPEIKKIKILAVEDVPLNQLLLKITIDEFGFEGDFAENGKVAIEKLQSDTYDIVLMDLQMPEMNGLEATEYIRKKMNSKIPIIALTADVTMEDLEKCRTIGMNDHVAKPIDEKLLYKKIVELVIKP